MIAKRSVVGMFGNGHHLDGVVAKFGNAGEDEGTKFLVGSYFFSFGGDAEMGFVDSRSRRFWRRFVFPLIGFGWVPDGAGEFVSFGVLCGVASKG